MTRLCTICARGGSKGLPGKNLALLLGRPLVAWSVIQARETGLFAHVAVSSDSEFILRAAGDAGADVLVARPPELASDSAGKLPAIQHCVAETERRVGSPFDVVVDLDATAPLRLPDDVTAAVRLLETGDATNVITACLARRSPYFNLVEMSEDGVVRLSKPSSTPVLRRQDAPRCYDMNASIYAWWRGALMGSASVFQERTRLHEMPRERSVDIDDDVDLELVRLLAERARR